MTIARPRAHTTRQELATMGVATLKAAREQERGELERFSIPVPPPEKCAVML